VRQDKRNHRILALRAKRRREVELVVPQQAQQAVQVEQEEQAAVLVVRELEVQVAEAPQVGLQQEAVNLQVPRLQVVLRELHHQAVVLLQQPVHRQVVPLQDLRPEELQEQAVQQQQVRPQAALVVLQERQHREEAGALARKGLMKVEQDSLQLLLQEAYHPISFLKVWEKRPVLN